MPKIPIEQALANLREKPARLPVEQALLNIRQQKLPTVPKEGLPPVEEALTKIRGISPEEDWRQTAKEWVAPEIPKTAGRWGLPADPSRMAEPGITISPLTEEKLIPLRFPKIEKAIAKAPALVWKLTHKPAKMTVEGWEQVGTLVGSGLGEAYGLVIGSEAKKKSFYYNFLKAAPEVVGKEIIGKFGAPVTTPEFWMTYAALSEAGPLVARAAAKTGWSTAAWTKSKAAIWIGKHFSKLNKWQAKQAAIKIAKQMKKIKGYSAKAKKEYIRKVILKQFKEPMTLDLNYKSPLNELRRASGQMRAGTLTPTTPSAVKTISDQIDDVMRVRQNIEIATAPALEPTLKASQLAEIDGVINSVKTAITLAFKGMNKDAVEYAKEQISALDTIQKTTIPTEREVEEAEVKPVLPPKVIAKKKVIEKATIDRIIDGQERMRPATTTKTDWREALGPGMYMKVFKDFEFLSRPDVKAQEMGMDEDELREAIVKRIKERKEEVKYVETEPALKERAEKVQDFQMGENIKVKNIAGVEVTLPKDEKYKAYFMKDEMTGKDIVHLVDGKEVTVYKGQMNKLKGELIGAPVVKKAKPPVTEKVKPPVKKKLSKEETVKAYTGMVKDLAVAHKGLGLNFSELQSAGNLAILNAIKSYDPKKGVKFSTYVWKAINNQMNADIKNLRPGAVIRKPKQVSINVSKMEAFINQYQQEHDKAPTDLEIGQELQIPSAKVKDLKKWAKLKLPVEPVRDKEGELIGDEEMYESTEKLYAAIGIPISEETIIAFGDKIFNAPVEKVSTVKSILRRQQADRALLLDRLQRVMDATQIFFDRQSTEDNIKFLDKMERGELQETPELNKIAKNLKRILDRAYDEDVAYEDKLNYIENYFPHIWKNAKKAKSYVKKFSRTPAFAKKRYHRLIADGIKAGLELKSMNPVDLVLMRADASAHNKMTKEILSQLKSYGLAQFQKGVGAAPEGWSKVGTTKEGEPMLRAFFPTEKGVVVGGDYIFPTPTANVLRRWLSPSWWHSDNLGGSAFRGIMRAKNMMVSIMLTLSGFHTIETGLSAISSNITVGIEQIARGDYAKGLWSIVGRNIPGIFPILPLVEGFATRKAWYKGAKTSGQEKAVELLTRGGMRPRMSKYWRVNGIRTIRRALMKGEYLGATLEIIPAITEILSTPVMEWWVPQLKISTYLKNASDFIAAHPNMTDIEQDKELGTIARNIDARFGQVVYDNLFWDKTIKELTMAMSLSLGWNWGNFDQFAGGVYDFSNSIYNMTYGKALPGEPGKLPLRQKEVKFTDRTIYLMVYVMIVGMFGGLVTWALTKKRPEELLDYYAPRTGNKNPDGSDERLTLPAGTKEYFAMREALRKHGLVTGPALYASHKFSPLLSQFSQLLMNRDYFGTEIRDINAPKFVQGKQFLEYLASANRPFSIQGYLRQKEMGTPTIMPFLGMNPAPSYITKTKIQKEIGDIWVKRFGGSVKSREQWEKGQIKKKIRRRMEKNELLTSSEMQQMIRDGVVSFGWFEKMYKLQRQGVLGRGDIVMFQRLPEEDQQALIERMTDKEKMTYMRYAQKNLKIKYQKFLR